MKTMIFLIALLSTSSGFALVRQLASCTTSNNQYYVSVLNNEGIAPVRKSNVYARIEYIHDGGRSPIAEYKVEEDTGPHSQSFGRQTYMDSSTSGKLFKIQGPSTNFRHYSLYARVEINGDFETIKDDSLNCTVFGGKILNP